MMNQIRLLFFQSQTLPPSMHHKWKEILDIVYNIIGDQLPTKSPIELKDNSNLAFLVDVSNFFATKRSDNLYGIWIC